MTVVEDENADVDSSDFAEFPEVDEDGNVIPSDDKDDDKIDNGKDDDKTDDGKDDDKNDDVEGVNVEKPSEAWGPFF